MEGGGGWLHVGREQAKAAYGVFLWARKSKVSSGEVEDPAITPWPVTAVEQGKKKAGQEMEYKRRPLTFLGMLTWAQVKMIAPKTPGRARMQHSRTWLCLFPGTLSQEG